MILGAILSSALAVTALEMGLKRLFMKKSTVKMAFAAVATVGACLFSSASFAEDLTASLVNHGIPLSSKYPTQYYARNPWDLKAFEGRLYIGSGNSANAGPNKNAGPVPIMSYDPATGNCVEELVIQQEQIDVFRILDDGGLYIPGHDPKGGNGSVYLRAPGASDANAWKQFNNLTGCEHCYDAIMFDGKFIASGSNLWVSPDDNAANVAAFTAYNITGRRYAMLRFPNTLYAVGWDVHELPYGRFRVPHGDDLCAEEALGRHERRRDLLARFGDERRDPPQEHDLEERLPHQGRRSREASLAPARARRSDSLGPVTLTS